MELKINKLRGRMGELNTNLSKLEKETGISRRSLRFIFDSKRKPRPSTVLKICKALRIEENKILYYFPDYVPETSTKKESD